MRKRGVITSTGTLSFVHRYLVVVVVVVKCVIRVLLLPFDEKKKKKIREEEREREERTTESRYAMHFLSLQRSDTSREEDIR